MAKDINLEDIRRIARRKVPRAVFEFVDGGAEDERSLAWNRCSFADVRFRPRVLVDVANRDLRTKVFGQELSFPVVLAPAGLARLVHHEGELAAVRAAGASGTAFALSTASSCTIEDVGAAATGPLWFQLYLWQNQEVVGGLMDRAWVSGARVLVLTADVPIVGQRERDLRNGMTIPPRITPRNIVDASWRVRWVRDLLVRRPITFENFLGATSAGDSATALGTYVNRDLINPAASWRDLDWVRDRWQGKLAVKGILTAEDAREAVDRGADGIIVSNHGGRQLDGAPGTLEVLPEVVDAVGDRTEVLLDGGVRRGTDVIKALALGARAVCVGRPWFYGLAAGGEAGVRRVLELLHEEMDRSMALLGRPTIADLDRTAVVVNGRHSVQPEG